MGSEVLFATALIAGLLFLLLTGLEIGWSIGIISLIGLVFFIEQPINQIAYTSWNALNSFTLTAMPLFILMGSVLGNTGVNEKIFNAIDKWVGHLPGGLAVSVIFGGIMTSTEAAGLGAFLSILLTLFYRKLTFRIFSDSLMDTVRITSFALFIMAMSTLIFHVFNSAGLIPLLKDYVLGLAIGKYGILFGFFVMYFLWECFSTPGPCFF